MVHNSNNPDLLLSDKYFYTFFHIFCTRQIIVLKADLKAGILPSYLN